MTVNACIGLEFYDRSMRLLEKRTGGPYNVQSVFEISHINCAINYQLGQYIKKDWVLRILQDLPVLRKARRTSKQSIRLPLTARSN